MALQTLQSPELGTRLRWVAHGTPDILESPELGTRLRWVTYGTPDTLDYRDLGSFSTKSHC